MRQQEIENKVREVEEHEKKVYNLQKELEYGPQFLIQPRQSI